MKISGIEACSSGVGATKDLNGPISWYTKEILEKNGLTLFDKGHWNQTSVRILENSDLIIFMDQSCCDDCLVLCGDNPIKKSYEVWSINDIDDVLTLEERKNETVAERVTDQIYETIKSRIDTLVDSLDLKQVV